MDQIKPINVKAVEITEKFPKTDFLTYSGKDHEIQILDDLEMAYVGGGDGMVCW